MKLNWQFSLSSIYALFCSTAGYLGVFLLWRHGEFDIHTFIDVEVTIMLGLACSFAVSVAMFFAVKATVYWVFLAFRVVVLMRLFGIFQDILSIGVVLAFPLLIEVAVYDNFPLNLEIGSAIIIVSIVIKLYITRYSVAIINFRNIGAYVFSSSLIIVVSSLRTRYRQKIIELSREVIRLDSAVSNLSDASKGYLIETRLVEKRSIKQERERITSELHDGIGYTLTNLSMTLEAAKAYADHDPEELRCSLDSASEQIQQCFFETRKSSTGDLRTRWNSCHRETFTYL